MIMAKIIMKIINNIWIMNNDNNGEMKIMK